MEVNIWSCLSNKSLPELYKHNFSLSAILIDDFDPNCPLQHQQKDLRLAISLGDSVDQPLPVTASANEVRAEQHFKSFYNEYSHTFIDESLTQICGFPHFSCVGVNFFKNKLTLFYKSILLSCFSHLDL
jgi:hypothetical protein